MEVLVDTIYKNQQNLIELKEGLDQLLQYYQQGMLEAAAKLYNLISAKDIENIQSYIVEINSEFNIKDVFAIQIEGTNALEHAVNNKNIDILKQVLKYCDQDFLTSKFSDGRLPLARAVDDNDVYFLNYLLGKEVNANIVITNQKYGDFTSWFLSFFYIIGKTPLHVAIEQYISPDYQEMRGERLKLIKAFIYNDDTKANIPDYNGKTAIEMIESNQELKEKLEVGLLNKLDSKDATNYVDLAKHNIYLQYGVMTGKLLVAPAIECIDNIVISKNESQDFNQCYWNSFTADNVIAALKYPALSLALQHYISPAYVMLGMSFGDLLESDAASLTEGLISVISGFALNAAAYYYTGEQPIYKDHPFLVGMAMTTAIPIAQLLKDIIIDGYDQLYYGVIGHGSGVLSEDQIL
jgi:hypothetical protein